MWPPSWSQKGAKIYPSLERLERDGLVIGTDDPAGRRPRRVFAVTDRGKKVLKAWLVDVQSIPFELRDVGLLKLFFADRLGHDDATELLRAVQRRSHKRVATLAVIRPAAAQLRAHDNIYPLLTLELGIAFHQAIVDVCATFADRRRNRRAR